MASLFAKVRGNLLKFAGGAIGIAVIAVVFFVVLPSIAHPSDVWEAVKGLSLLWLAVLALTAALNLATYAPPYQAALPGLRFRPALAVTTASTASTFIAPGGAAVGMGLAFAMLRAWGFRGRSTTIAVTVTTVWNQFMIFGTPVVALFWLTQSGGANALLGTLSVVGVAIFAAIVVGFALALSSARQAKRVGDLAANLASRGMRLIRRGRVKWSGVSFVRFRAETIGLLRRRWHWITLATITGHLTVYFVLLATIRAMGISGDEVSLAESFAAWSLVRVLGSIPITPGGFGVVELGLTGALVGFGGPNAEVVGAVLVYRFLTIVPTLVAGSLFGATWSRHNPHAAAELAAEREGA